MDSEHLLLYVGEDNQIRIVAPASISVKVLDVRKSKGPSVIDPCSLEVIRWDEAARIGTKEDLIRRARTVIENLTPRRRQVLLLLAQGLSNKEIARRIDISEATVKFHVRCVIHNLGLQRRGQIAFLMTNMKKEEGND